MIKNVKLKVDLLGKPGEGFYVEWDGNPGGGFPTLELLEEYIAKGEDTIDMLEEGRIGGVEEPLILIEMARMGYPVAKDVLALAEKYAEDEELTDEEVRRIADEVERHGKDLLVVRWNPAEVVWTPEARHTKEVITHKYSYEELAPLKRDEINRIAKLKRLSAAGTKEDVARRISMYDLGDGVLDRKLDAMEKMLKEIPQAPEKPQVKLTPENIEWAIDETLTHIAGDWIKRNVRELLKEGKRDEALKFLRKQCRYFGVASPGKPHVHGSEKGILITSAIMNPEETKLVTWDELLKRIEREEVKPETVGEHGEKWSREFEEAKRKAVGGGEEKVWYGVNVFDLTEIPGIETVGAILLPPREEGYTMARGPKIDDDYIFWHIPKSRAEGIDHMLKLKLPRIRTQTLVHPPKPYKRVR